MLLPYPLSWLILPSYPAEPNGHSLGMLGEDTGCQHLLFWHERHQCACGSGKITCQGHAQHKGKPGSAGQADLAANSNVGHASNTRAPAILQRSGWRQQRHCVAGCRHLLSQASLHARPHCKVLLLTITITY